MQLYLDFKMDDPKCAKTHLSITETSNICKFMLVALTYCKFMSRRCQSALLSYKQRSLHTKIVFHNFPLSLSHCMHSYLWMFFHVVGPSLAFTHCHSSYTMSCRFKLINNLWTLTFSTMKNILKANINQVQYIYIYIY